MKTVGNDLVRHQLHKNRKWYLILGILLIVFGIILFASLPFATLSVIFLFGILMMVGGVLHMIAGFKIFSGGYRFLWLLFGILYFVAGYYAFSTPIETAVVLTSLLAIFLIIAGIVRIFNALFFRAVQGWGWTLFSGILTLLAGIVILRTPDAPFWVLGLFLAMDILFQGINYLSLASYIKHDVPKSSADQ
ncbi:MULTISPECIES: HdeD family acid-resistance protein [unclassified Acinetobacter]|uniref:HdeD family acid-resistance protein n=1 Tax=unclassified Acinetobacter TaxID=196816 RepID=UPI00293501AA|nr:MULTISPECIES: HdeD family acid-resistance protein [unclassified Acinetobacter]WOE31220.1 HdeD family acid-resistance protein [Acinetobacter sp. SAAs470]WOE39416.1 HdeD family acid-resistance protein [Acinetobacter sp. SAAs474]